MLHHRYDSGRDDPCVCGRFVLVNMQVLVETGRLELCWQFCLMSVIHNEQQCGCTNCFAKTFSFRERDVTTTSFLTEEACEGID